MAGKDEEERTLEHTPTWAVACVCFVLIAISICVEHLIHLLTKYFENRKSLYQALYKIKSELILFGFISFFLTITKEPISKICIPEKAGETFLPCNDIELSSKIEEESSCKRQGKISLLSVRGVGELQILIFVLAVYHVLSCVLTFCLGMAKMKQWETWEEETGTVEYQSSHDPRRFRLTKQTTFAQRHMKLWSDHRLFRWPICFLRQFHGSVSKTDYTTLRHGFIMAHFAEGSVFNFQKFIKRVLDNDFQVVVGVSVWIWVFSAVFIFFNAHGFYNYLWLPFIPLVMLLVVGAKLQVIITRMCLKSRSKGPVVMGTFLVTPHDSFFWFSNPQLLLHLMHFILFQNSFQLAFFTWTWFKFGLRSCYHRKTVDVVIRMSTGLLVQLLCGYVTLPLYALVTQMGSSIKKEVFTEEVIVGLKNWHTLAKGNVSKINSPEGTVSKVNPPAASNSILEQKDIPMQQSDGPLQDTGYQSVEIVEEERKGLSEIEEVTNQKP